MAETYCIVSFPHRDNKDEPLATWELHGSKLPPLPTISMATCSNIDDHGSSNGGEGGHWASPYWFGGGVDEGEQCQHRIFLPGGVGKEGESGFATTY